MVSTIIPLTDLERSVRAIEHSDNRKLSDGGYCSATWVSLDSCPECIWKDNGCYSQLHWSGNKTRKMGEASNGQFSSRDLALEEARKIDLLTGRSPLRLHTSGDCDTEEAARIVAESCGRYMNRHGQSAWGYTHKRPLPPRDAWGTVSMLASCETMEHVENATDSGYASALTVAKYLSDKPYELISERTKLTRRYIGIPCPNETRGTKCVDCRLCWNDKRLLGASDGITRVVLFKLHGAKRLKMAIHTEF